MTDESYLIVVDMSTLFQKKLVINSGPFSSLGAARQKAASLPSEWNPTIYELIERTGEEDD